MEGAKYLMNNWRNTIENKRITTWTERKRPDSQFPRKINEYTKHSETNRKVAVKSEQAWLLLEQEREESVKPISASPVYRFYK